MTVVNDLRQLVIQISKERLHVEDMSSVSLVLVGNSIGCALGRLYADEFPGSVAGFLILDSVIANSDYVEVWPNPDASEFNEQSLPQGVSPDLLRTLRAKYRNMLHPDVDVGSREGFSRKNLADRFVAQSSEPVLTGLDGRGPILL